MNPALENTRTPMKKPAVQADPPPASTRAGCQPPKRAFARPILAGLGLALLLGSVGLPAGQAADAAPPEFMTYQGYLVDANGNPLAPNNPANYRVVFRIYDNSTGGNRLWTEQQIVTIDKGNFSVLLGEGSTFGSESRPSLSTVFNGTRLPTGSSGSR